MSKLGPHVLNVTAAALDWARRAPVVKAVDRIDALEAAPDSAIRIFRQTYANEMDTTDPQGTINQIVAGLKGYWHPQLFVQIWTGAHPTYQQLATAVVYCHLNNLRTVGSSWFTGDYGADDWDIATRSGVDAYGPQCYWGDQGFTKFHALRYRQFWQPGQAPVMILECGRDKIEGGAGGYGILKPSWTDQQIAADLGLYEAEIEKDSYLIGATPFTCGATPDWTVKGFNLDSVAHLLGRGGPMPDPTTFNVGQGVKDLMAQNGDAPESDEHYVEDATGAVFKSETFGSKGIYQWNKQANKTVLLPFR